MIVDDSGQYMLNGRTLYQRQYGGWVAVQRFETKVTITGAIAEYEGAEDEATEDSD